MGKFAKYSEIYKCGALTVIALLLAGILLSHRFPASPRAPVPVFVRGGSIDVDNTVRVDVDNTVDVHVDNKVHVDVDDTVPIRVDVDNTLPIPVKIQR